MHYVPAPAGPLSAEQFLELALDAPERELWDGSMYVREPAGSYSSRVNAELVRRIANHVAERGLGFVTESSAGFVVQRGPDRVLAPDVAFVRNGRPWPEVGFFEGAPDFAVEVRSPSQTWEATLARGGIWLAHGVRLVWLVDSTQARAVELRPETPPMLLGPEGVLRGQPVLPDLEIRLESLGIAAQRP